MTIIKEIKIEGTEALGQVEVLMKEEAFKVTIEELILVRAKIRKDCLVAWDYFEEIIRKELPSYDENKHAVDVNSKDNTLQVKLRT